MKYHEAVAISAARSANQPWMRCRCGANVQAGGDGSSFCNSGVQHFKCPSCLRQWDSTRDYTADDWSEYSRRAWRSVHGRDPSPSTLAWLNDKSLPYVHDCDCDYCKKRAADRLSREAPQ
jgi:hypothetical protein